MRLQNAVIPLWTSENGGFLKQQRKNAPRTVAFVRVLGVAMRTIVENALKCMRSLVISPSFDIFFANTIILSSLTLSVLKERLDYTLREGYMETKYLSAVTSHTSYWYSCDVARCILENCLDPAQNLDQS